VSDDNNKQVPGYTERTDGNIWLATSPVAVVAILPVTIKQPVTRESDCLLFFF